MIRRVFIMALLVFTLGAPTALAGSKGCPNGYCGNAGGVQQQLGGGGPSQPTGANTPSTGVRPTGGTLPFTGLELGLLVVGGTLLVLVGGSLRRLTRARVQP